MSLEGAPGASSRYHPALWGSTLLCLASAIACLLFGHSGDHDIDWVQRGISTFAANAPRDDWVTASIFLFALCSVLLGLMLSLTGPLRHRLSAHVASMLLGSTAVGLCMVAWFEEVRNHPPRGYDAVRQQTFHDAGVMTFFFCALMALVVLGTSCLLCPPSSSAVGGRGDDGRHSSFLGARTQAWAERLLGLVLIGITPLTSAIKDRNWTGRLLGLPGAAMGLRQRTSFAVLGTGLLLATLLLRPSHLCGVCTSGRDDKPKVE
mmetsp:Transcript_6603/g.13083  ORF Transcript_6603/g.13083 Transcript_6603/m.13083 type:complete len:263 (-) Transcript_6603:23-811(-)